ncbi:glycosyltransferase [Chryseobacterium sp. Ch-15]|uniref:Glycosyltransferase n=1 Tax=Chryseobacterium muglaense TaxID=2893752 RepID=A0A9Q3UX02_9FLAO|nr:MULTISPECIES: glycosyltransferase [Chryseobacterium]MBD3904928.1 glycosyltransferase family 2 protein [Chryseobacterium muglaense]MBO6185668.1 glycosyltransferase family 2 protein [Chryseobacterium sp.]MCC9035205.1 glycosyltransferase [Chryseobacterium muglaense]MCM2554704.1 glycosyltransferase [Chryseobacterium muglaense]
MKISVCIPVYNFDVRELVYDLKKEIENHSIDAEIILIDDGSNENFIQINSELNHQVNQFILLEKNIGRSQIRNLFLGYSNSEYLLFLDCDGKIISQNFLKSYVDFLDENSNVAVVYGGRKVSEKPSSENHILRWKFAVERENLPLEKRKMKPYLSFQTNNFLIHRNVFESIKFNPDLLKYGYEDLVFSMDLKFAKIPVIHIDNPIYNNDVEEGSVYLKKVDESVESLLLMLNNQALSPKLSEIKLVKAYESVCKKRLKFPVLILFNFIEKFLKKNLLSGNPNLKFLDLYKLGLMLRKAK